VAAGLDRYPDLVATTAAMAPAPSGRRGKGWPARAAALALAAAALAGCSAGAAAGQSPAQISGWMSTSGEGTLIGQVQVDSANVALAVRKHEPGPALRTVCALLSTDALTGIGNLPSPDTTLTDELNTAFGTAATAAQDCYKGASGTASLLVASAADRAKLAHLFGVAVARVATLTGKTPSTSTTLAPDVSPDPFGN